MMLKKYALIASLFVLLPSINVAAAPTGLLDLYLKAKVEDPDFGAASSNYQAGLKNIDIGRAGLLPNVSASLSMTQNRYGIAGTASPKMTDYNFNSVTKSIQLSQSIFDWEKISAYNESAARTTYAEAAYAEAKTDLILRVAQAYFNYLLSYDNLDLANAQKNALARQSEQAAKLHQSGVGTVTDEEETRARHEIAEAQLQSATSALEVRWRELSKMVGLTSKDIRRIDGRFDLAAPEPKILNTWLEAGVQQNLKVLSQRVNLKVAEAQLERSRSGHLPNLSLVASYQQGTDANYFSSKTDDQRLGLQLNIPLYEGGKTSALTEQARYQKDKVAHDLESAIRDSQTKVSQAYLGVVNGIAQVLALEKAVKSSETALKGMEVAQRAGFRTNTDVLNAQQQLYSVKRDLQRERYNYLLSRLQLNAEVGTLSDDSVELIDKLIKESK